MGDDHRGRGDGDAGTEMTEVDDADDGDTASRETSSRECGSQMGVLRDVLVIDCRACTRRPRPSTQSWRGPVDSLKPSLGVDVPHVGTTSRYSVVSTPCTGPDPASSTKRPRTPSSRESAPMGPTSSRAPNDPNVPLGQVGPFVQGESESSSNSSRVYSVRPIKTWSTTLSCATGFSVAALVPEKPMLRSRSVVSRVASPKSTSPFPRVDPRRSRFVLVLFVE
jgi:hypothetical protein